MQRASHRVADNETVGEGAVVVGTVSAHSEDLIATSNQNCVLAINLTRYHLPIPQILLREACSEIRLRLLCVVVHVVLQKRSLSTVVYIVALDTRCEREIQLCVRRGVDFQLSSTAHSLRCADRLWESVNEVSEASHNGGLTREVVLLVLAPLGV